LLRVQNYTLYSPKQYFFRVIFCLFAKLFLRRWFEDG
jgi:hypothetical protein